MSQQNHPLPAPIDAPDMIDVIEDLRAQARTVVAFEQSDEWAELAGDLEQLLVAHENAAATPARRVRRMRGWR